MHSLDPIGDSLKTLGISVTTTVHEPSPRSQEPPDPSHIAVTPAQHIVEEAGKDSDTLIVMGTHGRSGIGRWVMGSVIDKVLHATANPLMIVRCKEESAPGDVKLDAIILPWDGSAVAEQVGPMPWPFPKAWG